ncbi:AmmeMemoRadiSam system protein B [Stackebrandtia soli]|uniref:AmmeMemoRadiSam system protein B n=1 Tax=Stackebrandtia soli TaxID=1892856 RepID=UPI0039E9B56A
MTETRPPAVAGRFYSADPVRLRSSIDDLVDPIVVDEGEALASGYVVPHAGYRYSGPVAAQVYARLRAHAGRVGRVVLVGPSHFVPFRGAAASSVAGWDTPLGTVAVRQVPGVPLNDAPHAREHSLEVQLPFLQRCVGDVAITPIVIGQSTIEEAAAVIDSAATDDALVLCSTDLSHYLNAEDARVRDTATAEAIVALEPRRVGVRDACGVYALRGMLAWAAHRGFASRLVDLRSSADTTGVADRVVGYPAFAFG